VSPQNILEKIVVDKYYEDWHGQAFSEVLGGREYIGIRIPVKEEWRDLAHRVGSLSPGSKAHLMARAFYNDAKGNPEGRRNFYVTYRAYRFLKRAAEKFGIDDVLVQSTYGMMSLIYDRHYRNAEFRQDMMAYSRLYMHNDSSVGALYEISDVLCDYSLYLEKDYPADYNEAKFLELDVRKKMLELQHHDVENYLCLMRCCISLDRKIDVLRYYKDAMEMHSRGQLVESQFFGQDTAPSDFMLDLMHNRYYEAKQMITYGMQSQQYPCA